MKTDNKLRELMEHHQLTAKEVAAALNKSIDTVKSWLVDSSSDKYRNMPDFLFNYLQAQTLLKKCNKKDDINFLISSNIESAECHLKNSLHFFVANNGNENAIADLQRALDDISLTSALIKDAGLDPMYNELLKASIADN